jgi:hypothetical protein
MLISAGDLKSRYTKFADISEDLITRKLSVIESAIRKYTNNNFQNRLVRFSASVEGGVIKGTSPYLKSLDTIEISDGVNKGLYTVISLDNGIKTIEPLYDYPNQLITKIDYPIDVIEGAIDLLDWELIKEGKELTGVASESISRHNVSYVQRTNDNTINGYPIELFNFCNNYKKARF